MAELFLQDLGPVFVAQTTGFDFGVDLFVGFRNEQGGVNIVMVEVKATEQLATQRWSLKRSQYALLSESNVPALILVVDVKRSRYFYALANQSLAIGKGESVSFDIIEVDDKERTALVDKLSKAAVLPP